MPEFDRRAWAALRKRIQWLSLPLTAPPPLASARLLTLNHRAWPLGGMADAGDLKSLDRNIVPVRVREGPLPPTLHAADHLYVVAASLVARSRPTIACCLGVTRRREWARAALRERAAGGHRATSFTPAWWRKRDLVQLRTAPSVRGAKRRHSAIECCVKRSAVRQLGARQATKSSAWVRRNGTSARIERRRIEPRLSTVAGQAQNDARNTAVPSALHGRTARALHRVAGVRCRIVNSTASEQPKAQPHPRAQHVPGAHCEKCSAVSDGAALARSHGTFALAAVTTRSDMPIALLGLFRSTGVQMGGQAPGPSRATAA